MSRCFATVWGHARWCPSRNDALAERCARDLRLDLTDWLEDISGQWWFLLVILVIAFLDSVIPIVPSETTVILGGVAAGAGDQNLLLVILAGASARSSATTPPTSSAGGSRPWIERRAEQPARRRPSAWTWAHDQIRSAAGCC